MIPAAFISILERVFAIANKKLPLSFFLFFYFFFEQQRATGMRLCVHHVSGDIASTSKLLSVVEWHEQSLSMDQ